MTTPIVDISGQRFGRLVAIEIAGRTKKNSVKWLCKCDCGSSTVSDGYSLRNGTTVSCGCRRIAHAKAIGNKNTKHGHAVSSNPSVSRTYSTWKSMIERCTKDSHASFEFYGGRGITFCNEWSNFANFLADMGERPTDKSLDRKDSNGNYNKENCRWATAKEQANNRRSNLLISALGKTQTASAWAEEFGMDKSTLILRIKSGRMTAEQALTTPVRKYQLKAKT